MPYIAYSKHQPVPQDEEYGYSQYAKTGYEPYSQQPSDYQTHATRDAVRKRNIRVLKFITRAITFGLSIYGVVSQALALHSFLSTKDIMRNDRNPWAKQTVIWPTIVLLSTSAVTVLISIFTLGSYCFSVKHANKVQTNAGVPIAIAESCAHLAIWISTAVAYRVGKTGSDLWGWSCDAPDAVHKLFPEVNFDFLCGVQVSLCRSCNPLTRSLN